MIYGLYAVHAEATFSAWFIGGLFTLFSIPIFLANLLQVRVREREYIDKFVAFLGSCAFCLFLL